MFYAPPTPTHHRPPPPCSWYLTWFAHDVPALGQAARLFDLFLSSHPLMPLYVAAVAIKVGGAVLPWKVCKPCAQGLCAALVCKESGRVPAAPSHQRTANGRICSGAV